MPPTMIDDNNEEIPVPEQQQLPLGFEGSLEFDKPDTQLAIRNQGRVNRQLAAHEALGRTGYSAYVRHVQYGTYQAKPACLLAIDFSFRFPTRSSSRFMSASLEVRFERAQQQENEAESSSFSSEDPEVVNFAPKRLSDGLPSQREVHRLFELEVPVQIEAVPFVSAGFSLKRSAGWVRTEEGRGRIHGTFYQDDEHDDGANGVTWDLEENHVSEEGIVRDLRTLVVLRFPRGPAAPFLMHVRVKPVVSWVALDARRLVRRLVGDRDDPVALDGRTQMGSPECLAHSDFDSEDFPWQILLSHT